MATSRKFISEVYWYRVVVPGYRVEDRVKTFVLRWRRGVGEVLMSVVFSFDNVLRFSVVTSLRGLWVVLAPGISEACRIDEPWFNWRLNWSAVEFQVIIVVVRIDC
jgi:hypothetical protein